MTRLSSAAGASSSSGTEWASAGTRASRKIQHVSFVIFILVMTNNRISLILV
jgi:hypothetical protein